jgi:hypothetical protein
VPAALTLLFAVVLGLLLGLSMSIQLRLRSVARRAILENSPPPSNARLRVRLLWFAISISICIVTVYFARDIELTFRFFRLVAFATAGVTAFMMYKIFWKNEEVSTR